MSSRRILDRFAAWLAVLACASFVVGLFDVALRTIEVVPSVPRVRHPGAPAGELTVRVVAANGGSLAGAEVRIYWEHERRYFEAGNRLTQPDGTATFGDLPQGAAWILADAPGYARGSTRIALDPARRALELRLDRAGELTVHVVDDTHAAIGGATVLVRGADPLPFGALTDATGTAHVGRLPPAPWAVKASARGYESITQSDVRGETTITLRRLGWLEVRVSGPDDKPAADATVFIAGATLWPARRAQTDAQGTARIVGLLEGSYDVRATKGPLVTDTVYGLHLERGAHESLTLRLKLGRMVTAIVTDGDDPTAIVVPNADVVLVEGGLSSFPLRGRTGTDGTVTLGPIAPGPASLAASAEDFVPRTAIPVPEPLDGPVKIPLLKGATLTGDVVDGRGFPIGGASVEIIGTDVYGLPVSQTPLLMNFGRAHFAWSLGGPVPLIPAGELGVMPGPVPPIPGSAGAGRTSELVDTLGSDAPLGSDDRTDQAQADVAPWVSGSDGSFRAHPVPPGRLRALVRHPDYVEGLSELVTLGPGGEAHVRVVLHPGGLLEGRVLDDRDMPAAGARVDVAAVRGTFTRSTLTAIDGSFAFAAVPRELLISLARPDDLSRIVVRKTIFVKEGERNEIELSLPKPRDPIAVKVLDDVDQPIEGAQVTALSLDPEIPFRQTRFTDDQGKVTFDDARGLALRLVAEATGWIKAVRPVDAAPEEVKLSLVRGVVVTGRVTSVRGRWPVAGATVTLAADGTHAVALTDDTGTYTLRDVPPGWVEIDVSHPEHADGSLRVEIRPTGRADRAFEIDPIDLVEGGGIEGVVVRADGTPVMGARVGLGTIPAYLPIGALPPGMTTTDQHGGFKLTGVRPGRTTVGAYAAGIGHGEARDVDVTAERTTSDVRVVLSERGSDEEPPMTASVAITLGERPGADGQEIFISQVAGASEAERGGLRPGDVIAAIDGRAPGGVTDARDRLNGPLNSDVVIEVRRGADSVRLRIAREAVRQ